MRFDILLAAISSGILAPLALMAGGFLLAVGGIIFLLWRRKKAANPAPEFEALAPETLDVSEPAPLSKPVSAPAPVAQQQEGRRRRSLVGGAERESGTPAGEEFGQDEETQSAPEFAAEADTIEKSEFAEYDRDQEEPIEAEDWTEAEDQGDDMALDPEWIEPSEPAKAELTDGKEDEGEAYSIEAAASATAAVTAAATVSGMGTRTAVASDEIGDLDAQTPVDATEPDDFEANGQTEPELAAEAANICEEPDQPAPAEILAAHKRPIVFRQFMPQKPGEDGLSFFGGQPIGPSDFQWPRERGAQGGSPLQFVMQWDCSLLSEQDPTGLLPKDGVLYCFINNDHDGEEDFLASHSFIHHRGAVDAWAPVPVPEDAGPALGRLRAFELSGCCEFVDNAENYVPRTLPRFPFAPVAFDLPVVSEDGSDTWSNPNMVSALLEVHQNANAAQELANGNENSQHELGRPFPSFPHDFGAVRVLANRMIECLSVPNNQLVEALYANLSAHERDEQFAASIDEAKEIYLLGTQRPQGQKLEQNIADDIWQWFEERSGVLGGVDGDGARAIYEEAVDLSLGTGSEALNTVPAYLIDKAMASHALAFENTLSGADGVSHIEATTPAHMFGPPSQTSNTVAAMAQEHILLLELPSGSGPEHHCDGRILQYWIAPDDLASGNFDEVKLVIHKA